MSASATRPTPCAPPRPRLLVVDDEQLVQRMFCRFLGQRYDVTGFHCAKSALEEIARGVRFDLILCDLQLDGMSGEQFVHELAVLDVEQAMRCVTMSADPAISAAVPHLMKPFSFDDVDVVLASLEERR